MATPDKHKINAFFSQVLNILVFIVIRYNHTHPTQIQKEDQVTNSVETM